MPDSEWMHKLHGHSLGLPRRQPLLFLVELQRESGGVVPSVGV